MIISFNTHKHGLTPARGFGVAGLSIVESLQELGHTVPFDYPDAPVQINFTHPENFVPRENQYQILYVPWESTDLKPGWREKMNLADEIWTPSDLIAKWFKNAQITKPIYVYQHGVSDIWKPKVREPSKKLRFLHHGSEASRKCGQMVLDAFIETFGRDNNEVTMTFKSNGPPPMRGKISGFLMTPEKMSNNIKVISNEFSDEHLVNLYHLNHVLVGASCLSEDTEILTLRGWVGPDDIKFNDFSASVNSSGDIEYVPVEKIYDYNFSGRIISGKNESYDFRLTDNHNVLIQDGNQRSVNKDMNVLAIGEVFDKYKKVKTKLHMPVVANRISGINMEYIDKSKLPIDDVKNCWSKDLPDKINVRALLMFLGLYISEGSYNFSESNIQKGKTQSLNIAQSKSVNPEIFQIIIDIVKQLGLNPVNDMDRGIKINSKELVSLVKDVGRGYRNKRIPRWVYMFGADNLQYLFDGMMLGDGTETEKSNHVSYYTSGERLVDDFQELCFLLGYRTTVNKRVGVDRYIGDRKISKDNTVDNYQIGISKVKLAGTIRPEQMSEEAVTNERVWCIQNRNSTIVIRRNNKVFVTKNCGEGFGLTALQALATGMPVIMNTTWAPYRKYTLKDLRVDDRLVDTLWPEEHPGMVLEPSYNQLCKNMLKTYDNFDGYAHNAYTNSKIIHKQYNWKLLTENAFERIVTKFN